MVKIYRIVDNTNGNVYIGKTTQKLYRRLMCHRKNFNCVSREIIKNGHYRIELIEETDDPTRERYWIENTDCINQIIPGRTKKEYREKNKVSEDNRKRSTIKNNWMSSMGGRPGDNNMSLLKIDPNLFS